MSIFEIARNLKTTIALWLLWRRIFVFKPIHMMFPGAVANTELQQAAADKVKNDVGTFVLFGLLIEAVAFTASYFGIEGVLL
ncbi:unnamed protein product [Cylicostephanus goldi]|uniref:Uncharacterized protein n=1 Tax=Cylicostephanus goldi TaxID=71465 RepID=A0A3P7PJ32_CYLGO|nr:unnamed protein product [Cylicostephanus goldi]